MVTSLIWSNPHNMLCFNSSFYWVNRMYNVMVMYKRYNSDWKNKETKCLRFYVMLLIRYSHLFVEIIYVLRKWKSFYTVSNESKFTEKNCLTAVLVRSRRWIALACDQGERGIPLYHIMIESTSWRTPILKGDSGGFQLSLWTALSRFSLFIVLL